MQFNNFQGITELYIVMIKQSMHTKNEEMSIHLHENKKIKTL
jgi:hypothetical protein